MKIQTIETLRARMNAGLSFEEAVTHRPHRRLKPGDENCEATKDPADGVGTTRRAFDDDGLDIRNQVRWFRSLAYIENGTCRLVFTQRQRLSDALATCAQTHCPQQINAKNAILDGELVVLDTHGRSLFYDLMGTAV